MTNTKKLMESAKNAKRHAYAPYSRFAVGAALSTKDGKVYAGCNIENASYGATVCAERVAVYAAVSAGEKKFNKLAVFTSSKKLPLPCGICRQVLWELAGDMEIIVTGGSRTKIFRLSKILPAPFEF